MGDLAFSRLRPLSPYPALLLERRGERILLVADLHIGWEVTLARQGIHVPSQTRKMLDKMTQVIEACKPTRLILIGDVKHAVARVEMEEWRDVPEFFEKVVKLVPDVEVIPGNHDGNIEPLTPSNIRIMPSSGLSIWKDVGVFHGHAWPSPELLGCGGLVMGHLHPVVMFRDVMGFRIMRQVWVRARCNGEKLATALLKHLGISVKNDPNDEFKERFNVVLKSPECVILPSFNDFLGGQAINRRSTEKIPASRGEYIGPVLRSGSVDIENGEVYMLDGTFLGKIKQLRSLA